MPPNSRPDSDTDHQRWLASQGRRPSDDSIPIPIPRYGPYENDPYEMYDGDDVRPENVASYEAMHKPTNPNNNNNLPPSNPENYSQTLTYRTCISDMAVYYISIVVLLLVIRYAWRSQRQRQSDERDEEEELKPASRERFSTTGVTVDTTEQEKEKKRF